MIQEIWWATGVSSQLVATTVGCRTQKQLHVNAWSRLLCYTEYTVIKNRPWHRRPLQVTRWSGVKYGRVSGVPQQEGRHSFLEEVSPLIQMAYQFWTWVKISGLRLKSYCLEVPLVLDVSYIVYTKEHLLFIRTEICLHMDKGCSLG